MELGGEGKWAGDGGMGKHTQDRIGRKERMG